MQARVIPPSLSIFAARALLDSDQGLFLWRRERTAYRASSMDFSRTVSFELLPQPAHEGGNPAKIGSNSLQRGKGLSGGPES